MKKIKLFIILILPIFICGCNIIKTVSLLKSGNIENENYSEVIHFENRAGLMIIHMEIKGLQHDFILDTGAATVISQEIADDLNLEIKSRVNSGDSQDNIDKTTFTILPKFKIGNLCFNNIGTAIIDFNKIPEMKCLEIEGIIGANTMQLSKWQIDYQNNTITISDNKIIPEKSEKALTLDFDTNISGTPLIELNLPGNITVKDVFFDTGMNHSISLSKKYYFELIENNQNLKVVKGYGATSAGAFGSSKDSVSYVKLPRVISNELVLSNIITEFKGQKHNLIGNKILSNYKVSIDWETKKIFLIQVKEPGKDALKSFGFSPIMKDNKLFVGFVFENSQASDFGLKVGNQIISIDDVDYSNISTEQYCDLLMNHINEKGPKTIHLQWKKSNGELQKNSFERINLLAN